MIKLVFFLLYFLTSVQLNAQFYLQPELGQVFNNQIGANTIGTVLVTPNGGNNAVTSVNLQIGYQLDSSPFAISIRSRYFTGLYGFLLTDFEEDNGVFGSVIKSNTIGVGTLNVQPNLQLKVIKLGNWAFSVFAGPSLLFQFPQSNGNIDFNGRHLNTAEVINQLDDAVKPLNVGITLGGGLSYYRFSFTVDYHNSLNTSFTNDLTLFGDQYTFNNTARYVGFALGYSIFDKRRNKD